MWGNFAKPDSLDTKDYSFNVYSLPKEGLAAQKSDRNKLSIPTIPVPSPQAKFGRFSSHSWVGDRGSSALPHPAESEPRHQHNHDHDISMVADTRPTTYGNQAKNANKR
jgi:hypothetical protein